MTTFLISGATGFLGSALTDRFLKSGYKVIGLGRKEKGFLSNEILRHKHFTLLKSDIDKGLSKISKSINPDGIFHLASQQPSSDNLIYNDFYKGNVESILSIINFAKAKSAKFIVYTSTVSTPTSYYGLTKYIAEKLLEIELKNSKTKGIVVKYPSLFGKNHLGGIVYTYSQLAKKGQDIEVYGKGEKCRNLLYVTDAVSVLLEIPKNFDKLGKFEVFAARSKNSLKMIEIVQIIKKLLNSDSKIIPVDKNPSTEDGFIDISKTRKTLNFAPMRVEEGLRMYVKKIKHEI